MRDAQGFLTHLNQPAVGLFGVVSADEVKGFSPFEHPNLPAESKDRARAGDVARFE
jgi:hypothetical protein